MTDLLSPAEGGQGGAPPVTAATQLTAPAPAPTPIPVAPWMVGMDTDSVEYLQGKHFETPSDLLKSYKSAEAYIRVPEDNRLVLPPSEAGPEVWGKFYDKLGRPSDPAGYKIPVPEGVPPEFATGVAAKMHELGVTKAQGEALASYWNEQGAAAQAATKAALDASIAADDAALKKDWGSAFQQNVALAQSAVRALGIDKATIDKMEANMGLKATMELFQKIGSKTGEPDFVTGEGNQKFGNALTPGQAQAKIAELKTDHDFISKLSKGDAGARAELTRLNAFAYPEGS